MLIFFNNVVMIYIVKNICSQLIHVHTAYQTMYNNVYRITVFYSVTNHCIYSASVINAKKHYALFWQTVKADDLTSDCIINIMINIGNSITDFNYLPFQRHWQNSTGMV